MSLHYVSYRHFVCCLFLGVILSPVSSLKSPEDDLIKKIVTSGVSQMIWRNIVDSPITSVSDNCARSLEETRRALRQSSSWAYEFLDASAKTSSNFMQGTVSSFGDYDQCLQISSDESRITGKYCTIKFQFNFKTNDTSEIQSLVLERVPMFNYHFKQVGLCLPSQCTISDIKSIIRQSLAGHSIQDKLNIHCDTLTSVKWQSKWTRAPFGQKLAACILLSMVLLSLIATVEELFTKSKSLRFISLANNHRSLFSEGDESERVTFVDTLKLTIILAGAAGHTIGCLESIPAWYTISNLYVLKRYFSSFFVQPLLNEGGLGIGVTFVGGFVTYLSTHKYIMSGQLSYPRAVFNRWLRYTPALMAMVAIDIVWPFYGNGPMYTQISTHVQNTCLSSWWMNLLALGNVQSAPENCVAHTFYSSIDVHLFILGLAIVYLLCHKPIWGVIGSFLLVFIGNAWTVWAASNVLISPVLIDANPTTEKTINYIDHVHFATYSHLSNYFIGLLVAYCLSLDGFLERIKMLIAICYPVAVFLSGTVHFAPALHNTFNLLTKNTVPYYIIVLKFLYVFYTSVLLFNYRLSSGVVREKKKLLLDKDSLKEEIAREEEKLSAVASLITPKPIATAVVIVQRINETSIAALDELWSSTLMKAHVRLSFAIYVINYTFIRWDYFTSRVHNELIPGPIHLITKRLIYTYVLVMMAAYAYHMIIVAPLDNLRKRLTTSAVTKGQQRTCDHTETSLDK